MKPKDKKLNADDVRASLYKLQAALAFNEEDHAVLVQMRDAYEQWLALQEKHREADAALERLAQS